MYVLQGVMSAFGLNKAISNDDTSDFVSRRQYPRRESDQCIGMINGKAHPVLDWSLGGLRVFADSRPVNIGDEMTVEMKFHLRDNLISIQHKGHVVRKTNESVSLQFAPLTSDIRRTFQTVIDDFNAREFANSQGA